MLKKHTHLQHNDNLLVANVYSELYPNRYAFNQFLYNLAEGKVPTHSQIINIKQQIQNG
jgi:hypothetical protein